MTDTRQIVSANFHDRRGAKPWLLRSADQHPDQAVPQAAILATGVEFCPSTDYEAGFGCRIVGFCDKAIAVDPQQIAADPGGVPLHFTGSDFVTDKGVVVPKCHKLLLLPNGKMRTVVEKPEPVLVTTILEIDVIEIGGMTLVFASSSTSMRPTHQKADRGERPSPEHGAKAYHQTAARTRATV